MQPHTPIRETVFLLSIGSYLRNARMTVAIEEKDGHTVSLGVDHHEAQWQSTFLSRSGKVNKGGETVNLGSAYTQQKEKCSYIKGL